MVGLVGCGGVDAARVSGASDGGARALAPMAGMVDAGTTSAVCQASAMDELADAGPASSACDHYYAAQYLRCGGPALPACEVARLRARFVAGCLNEIALPGSGMTPAAVEACAQALDASACELPDGPVLATHRVRCRIVEVSASHKT